jgi:hypothetical protein
MVFPRIIPLVMISIRPALVALVSACLLACLPRAAAQEASVTLRFLSFPVMQEPAPVELAVGEGRTIQVEIPGNELSPPYKVRKQAAWVFGETVQGKDDKPSFTVFGQAPALASDDQLILLMRKGETNADGFDVIPVNGVKTAFGAGKFLFVNAAKVDIAGVIGSEKFVIKPGKHAMVHPKGEAGNKARGQVELYFNMDNQARPFFTSMWPLGDAARSLVFFFHDPESKRLRLHTIRDFPQ